MRIIYVADIEADPKSAQTVHVDEVCEQFAQLGHEVRLYLPKHSVPLEKKTYGVTYIPTTSAVSTLTFQCKLFFVLLKAIRQERPDLIYVRHSLLLIVPLIVASLRHIPIVFEVNGKLIKESSSRNRSTMGMILHVIGVFQLFEHFNFTRATRVVCVTEGIREFAIDTYNLSPQRCIAVNNGVNLDLFAPQATQQARTAVSLEPGAIYVGYVGSFFAWQGLRFVAEAARIVHQTNPEIKFVVVGEGDEKPWLQSFIAEHNLKDTLIIRDAVDRATVPVYMNSFDMCLCTPTRFREGSTSPFKVYEYLACGKAVIVSDIAGMREEFADNVTYVEPESATALARRIIELAANTAEREQLGATGRHTVETSRSWRVTVEKILASL